MFIKIIMSRLLGTEGLGMYMILLPTFTLFITLAQFGFPIAISKLIAEDTKNNIKLISSIIPISIIINILLMIIIFIISPYLSNNLLHDKRLLLPIISISLVIPFTSISSICRSYFFGKEKMFPHVISTITEDIIRLIMMIIGIPYFIKQGLINTLCFIILSNIISEITSIIILIFFLPKNINIKKDDLKPKKRYIKESLNIGIPNTTGKLIGSIGYFLEPIILTSTLLLVGYSNKYITTEYGILSGYVMPLLLLPSFFTLAISQALIPVISKEYTKNNYKEVKRKIKQSIIYSLLIGIPITILFILIPELFLKYIYNTNQGINYIKVLAPICLIQYIQAPLLSSLDAMGKSKDSMKATTIGVIIRTVFLIILSPLKIGIWSLIISISINVIIVTFYSIKKVRYNLT
ncbi:MAG: oligosaccharide flippase family protein [Bacilli bacterium]|nr:oligosaccharide flippase family protein [Bacilli bacterium]